MQTFARVQDGIVAEIVKIPANTPPLEERYHPDLIPAFVELSGPGSQSIGEGWLYDGSTFTAPAPVEAPEDPVPTSITPRQARLALLQAGLLDEVDAAVAAAGRAAQLEWEYATIVERNGALVERLAAGIPLTDQQVDDLFRAAAAL
ncbi:hypothetical protein [Roseomonas indoligenes]|uniref:Uncharacterized protein n=1 Tax=Roseomonas indoligenes TaxID=2820811 RepID=A0A940MVU2_9PROT|nr:hypothetical protein [Pararoseomonas indoligenes]MBP0492152.1 hypothetical protein [Pararoseomonas indoligenes]